MKFDKFKFKLADTAKTGGKIFAKVDRKNPLTISFEGKNAVGDNIKILWACGNNVDYSNVACAEFTVEFANGEKYKYYARKGSEIDNTKDAVHFVKRAMPAYVENPDSQTGVLYYYQLNFENRNMKLKSLTFSGRTLYIAAVSVSKWDVPSIETYDFNMDEWRAVDLSSLEILENSALDLSSGIGEKRAGKYGRLKVADGGHFAFEKRPDIRVKFKGTNWRPGDAFFKLIKNRDYIDRLASIIRRQGYNLVRWRISMNADEFESPWKLKPEVWDMYDYFLYALAREGVYTHLMIASHNLGNPDFKWKDRTQVKFQTILGDPKIREDWRKCAKMVLEHVNPYTNVAWKDDTSIATLEYFNEVEIGAHASDNLRRDVREWGEKMFVEYLRGKYGTFENWLAEQKKRGECWKGSPKSFDEVKIARGTSRHSDWTAFIIRRGREMNDFFRKVLREEIKSTVPVHQNNYALETGFGLLSDEAGDYISVNTYHGNGIGWALGAPNDPNSSLFDAANYFRRSAAKRVAGKPMMYSEWQHCHWNRLKHEGGIVLPAYSAFQDFDNLTIHDVAIALKGTDFIFERSIVNNSPVYRANEFLSYCLFYRGDISPAKNRVDIILDADYIKNSPYIANALNPEQTKIMLLTGFALRFASAQPHSPRVGFSSADIEIKPVGASRTIISRQSTRTGVSVGETFDIAAFVELLRRKKILPPENITDVKNGIYQSQNGEITMRQKEELVKAVTLGTEAVSLRSSTKNEKLGRLEVVSTSVDAAVAVTSVDGKNLSRSERMVLIYNTDNIAKDFKVSKEYIYIVSKGKHPVLMRVGKLSAKLKLPDTAKKYNLYSLKITGERAEKIPVSVSADGVMDIEIDTAKTKEISPFFEIAAD